MCFLFLSFSFNYSKVSFHFITVLFIHFPLISVIYFSGHQFETHIFSLFPSNYNKIKGAKEIRKKPMEIFSNEIKVSKAYETLELFKSKDEGTPNSNLPNLKP